MSRVDDFERQLKRFDLPRPREQAKLDIGWHFDIGPGICQVDHTEENSLYNLVRKQMVAFAKETDRFLAQAIIEKARENGITDLYVLNEDFIISAILEKRERETPDYWVPFIPPLSAGDVLYRCPRCCKTSDGGPTPYCPQCGKRLEVYKR